jgi:hypothetical protein
MTWKSVFWGIFGYGGRLLIKPVIITVAVMYPTTVAATVGTVSTFTGMGPAAVVVTCFLGFVLL